MELIKLLMNQIPDGENLGDDYIDDYAQAHRQYFDRCNPGVGDCTRATIAHLCFHHPQRTQVHQIIRRSYLVPTHLVPIHFVTTYCQQLLQFTLNLLKIETSFCINFNQRVEISGKYRRNYQDQTNSL